MDSTVTIQFAPVITADFPLDLHREKGFTRPRLFGKPIAQTRETMYHTVEQFYNKPRDDEFGDSIEGFRTPTYMRYLETKCHLIGVNIFDLIGYVEVFCGKCSGCKDPMKWHLIKAERQPVLHEIFLEVHAYCQCRCTYIVYLRASQPIKNGPCVTQFESKIEYWD